MASLISLTFFQALTLAIAMLLLTTSEASRASFTKLENGVGGGEQPECLTALSNIRSCSNEVIGFMLNGQADLDKPCCVAVATIAEFCWPALVAALGYSTETVTFLQEYCQNENTTDFKAAKAASP